MKERPILFSGEMVRAILEGRKTQTRRVVKPQPCEMNVWHGAIYDGEIDLNKTPCMEPKKSPYGVPGDRLWVRETFCTGSFYDCFQEDGVICYRATGGNATESDCAAWRPSIHMPRRASRITLEVTGVRVERVQDISEDDAKAEGVSLEKWDSYRVAYAELWSDLNAKRGFGWSVNPWVWVIEFRRMENAWQTTEENNFNIKTLEMDA